MSSNHNVEYILEDKGGNIWFDGRSNEGVYRYDGKFLTNLKVNEQKDLNWAWPAVQDRQGNIWFSNWNGAYRFDGKSFIKIDGLPTGPVSPVARIIEDKKRNLCFAGGGRGICRYDGKSFVSFSE
jgi:ligand-binding sensor domain-containing protein